MRISEYADSYGFLFFLFFLIFSKDFGGWEWLQTLPGAILVPDVLNMSPNGAAGTLFVSKTMIL